MITYYDNWDKETDNRKGIRSIFFEYEKYYVDSKTSKKVMNKKFDLEKAKKARNSKIGSMRMKDYPPLADLAEAIYWKEKGKPEKMKEYILKYDKVKKDHPFV